MSIEEVLGLENKELKDRCQRLEELVRAYHTWCTATAPYNYLQGNRGQALCERKNVLLSKEQEEQEHGH